MSASAAVTVERVGKDFRVRGSRPQTLKVAAMNWLRGRGATVETVTALRDVSFTVEPGRALGIIGHNGAGKSTLLRLLCGLGRPTSGQIRVHGPISGILDLGGGFHPDLTGRQNLTTVGILNGLSAKEVRVRAGNVIGFAELEDAIDHPVRTYSSGMYLRLAFAAAMEFDPAILVIDEVLAVGDARFQQKCLERMAAFRAAGNTLIVTSHVVEQIESLCDEVLVLEEGAVVMQGPPGTALACYHDLLRQRSERRVTQLGSGNPLASLATARGSRVGTQEATIAAVRLYDAEGRETDWLRSGESAMVELDYRIATPLDDLAVTLGIFAGTQVKCFETIVDSTTQTFGRLPRRGVLRCRLSRVPLAPGQYSINVGFYPSDWSFIYDYHWLMHTLTIVGTPGQLGQTSGLVALDGAWLLTPLDDCGVSPTLAAPSTPPSDLELRS